MNSLSSKKVSVSPRRRRRVLWLLAIGIALVAVGVGVRWWWAAAYPERLARAEATGRRLTLEAGIARAREEVAAKPTDTALRDRLALLLMAAGRVEEGFAEWRAATQVAPHDPLTWQRLANGYLSRQRYAAAEETFRQMIRRWPKLPQAYEGLAVIHRHNGRYREALEAGQRARALGSKQPSTHYVLGAIIEELGARVAFPQGHTALLLEGLQYLNTAAKAIPNHPDANFRRGRICLLLGRTDEANQALTEATRITPGRPVVWLALADARMRKGDIDGAVEAAQRARSLAPLEPEASLAIGRALVLKSDQKSLEEALAAFSEAERLAPERYECQQRLGTVLLRLQRLPEARAAFERATRLDPNEPYPVQQLSFIYRRLGEKELAQRAAKLAFVLAHNQRLLRQVQRASAAHPENHKIHLTLAERYRELHRYEQAEDEYLLTLKLAPGDSKARAGLAAVRRALASRSAP